MPLLSAPCVENTPSILEAHDTVRDVGGSCRSEMRAFQEKAVFSATVSPDTGVFQVIVGAVLTSKTICSTQLNPSGSVTWREMICVPSDNEE